MSETVSGYVTVTSATDDGDAGAWTDPTNIAGAHEPDDSRYASYVGATEDDNFDTLNFTHGLTVPNGAFIEGVVCHVRVRVGVAQVELHVDELQLDGSPALGDSDDTHDDANNWQTAITNDVKKFLTADIINAGVGTIRFHIEGDDPGTVDIGSVWIEITYLIPPDVSSGGNKTLIGLGNGLGLGGSGSGSGGGDWLASSRWLTASDSDSDPYLWSSAVDFKLLSTFACWFRQDVNDGISRLMTASYSLDTLDWAHAAAVGVNSGGPYPQGIFERGGQIEVAIANGSTAQAFGKWQHLMVVYTGTGFSVDLVVYLNGISVGTYDDAFAENWTANQDRFAIGRTIISGTDLFSETAFGIAHAAYWNVALDAADALALATPNTSPMVAVPQNLQNYWPLQEGDSDVDIIGGANLTAVNSPGYL